MHTHTYMHAHTRTHTQVGVDKMVGEMGGLIAQLRIMHTNLAMYTTV